MGNKNSKHTIHCRLNLSANVSQQTFDKGIIYPKHSGPDIHFHITMSRRANKLICLELDDAKRLLNVLIKEIQEAEYYNQPSRRSD